MAEYKLTYFNSKGRAEMSRLLFALAGVAYDDVRVNSDEWKELKPTTKFGLLPMLEHGGKAYTQSRAIFYYLGRKLGYYPTDVEEAFQVDETIFILEDYSNQAIKAIFAKDEDKLEQIMKEYKEVQVPKFNGFLEKVLKANDGGKGYFVGKKISIADIAVFDLLSRDMDALKDFPVLKAHIERIGNIDNIKKWVEKRPVTQL